MASFGPIAPFYDLLMRQVPYGMWSGYYRLLLAQLGAAPVTLLDVCCGTGSLAEILAKEGFQVTGFDASAAMIAEAVRKAKESGLEIDYHVADAATLDLGKEFDAAYSFFDSLNYITEPERLRAALRRLAAHVSTGGSFVFDLNTAYAFEKKMFDQEDMRKSSKLRYRWRGDYDPAERLIRVHMDFWHDGAAFNETHTQRAYSDDEIRAYLDEAGFDVARSYESYTLDPPRKTSDRVHYVAVRSPG